MPLFQRKAIRRSYTFYGSVQAVGFRYRAMQAAQLYGATGWVRNDKYGSVTMEIQGTEQQIAQVLAAIRKGTYIRIDHTEYTDIPVVEDERRFRVAY